MNNLFEELKKYFEMSSPEKVLEDWSKSAEFDKISPTVDEFIHTTQQYIQIRSEEPLEVCSVGNSKYNLKFTSGFFMFNKNISICKKQLFQS